MAYKSSFLYNLLDTEYILVQKHFTNIDDLKVIERVHFLNKIYKEQKEEEERLKKMSK